MIKSSPFNPKDSNSNNNISIYVHWPFCLSKCPYCDFNSHVVAEIDYNIWQQCYEKEIEFFAENIQGKNIHSIFFGGGTPSLMPPKITETIINKISQYGYVDKSTEITLEANPTSFEANKFESFKQAGINRLSIGVQSLRDSCLKKLGRNHSANEAIQVIKQTAKIFSNYSFDLIYARSNQQLDEWQAELKEALLLANGHISLYQLTIEKGTPFYNQFHRGDFTLPNDNESADMYDWTTEYLADNNYKRYEISNYAIEGLESNHNLTYWNYNSFLGIGPGAHSRLHNFREKTSVRSLMMIHKPNDWIKSVQNNGHGLQIDKILSNNEVISEIFMMGLRLKKGLSGEKLQTLTDTKILDSINIKLAKLYSEHGFLKFSDNHILLTDKGLMMHNYILPRLISV